MQRRDNRRRRPARSAAEWVRTIKDWQESGLSARAYAQEHDMSQYRLWAWAARFREEEVRSGTVVATNSPTSFRFLPVDVVDPGSAPVPGSRQTAGDLELEWPGGPVVRVRGVVTAELLAAVVGVLSGRSPC